MNPYIQALKNDGHQLLNEYVSLDRDRYIKSDAINHAYEKLAEKTGLMFGQVHFSSNNDPKDLMRCIEALRNMIRKRKNKYEYHAKLVSQLRESVGLKPIDSGDLI